MPFKDPERRREYLREWRKRQVTTDEDRAKKRARYWSNPEHYREQARLYRKRTSYYEKNKERIRAQQAASRAANPIPLEKEREYHRRYRAKYPEKNRARWMASRARRKEAFVERVDPRVVYENSMGLCGICGLALEDAFEIDHVVPISKGGKHCYDNVQAAHKACNRRKGGR